MVKFYNLDRYLDVDGTRIESFDGAKSYNVNSILELGVVGNMDKWFVTVTFISGATIKVNVAGTPFATQALAIAAKDALKSTLEALYS